MMFRTIDDNGIAGLELDEEGIDYLIEGLEELRDMGPGNTVSAPSLISNDGDPVGVGDFMLKYVADGTN